MCMFEHKCTQPVEGEPSTQHTPPSTPPPLLLGPLPTLAPRGGPEGDVEGVEGVVEGGREGGEGWRVV